MPKKSKTPVVPTLESLVAAVKPKDDLEDLLGIANEVPAAPAPKTTAKAAAIAAVTPKLKATEPKAPFKAKNHLHYFVHESRDDTQLVINLRFAIDVLGRRIMSEIMSPRHKGLDILQGIRFGLYERLRKLVPELPEGEDILNTEGSFKLKLQAKLDAAGGANTEAGKPLMRLLMSIPMSIEHQVKFDLGNAGDMDSVRMKDRIDAACEKQPDVPRADIVRRFQVQATKDLANLRPKLAPVMGVVAKLDTTSRSAAEFSKLDPEQQLELIGKIVSRLDNTLVGLTTRSNAPGLHEAQASYNEMNALYQKAMRDAQTPVTA